NACPLCLVDRRRNLSPNDGCFAPRVISGARYPRNSPMCPELRSCVRAALASLTLASLLPMARADDWPMLGRDWTRNPVSREKNPPTWWQHERDENDRIQPERNIKWKVKIGSLTRGDPVVSGGLVWVGTNNDLPRDPALKRAAAALMCFRASDGKFLYQYVSQVPQGESQILWNHSGHSSSPLAKGDRVWFTTARAEVVCLDVGPLRRGQ